MVIFALESIIYVTPSGTVIGYDIETEFVPELVIVTVSPDENEKPVGGVVFQVKVDASYI